MAILKNGRNWRDWSPPINWVRACRRDRSPSKKAIQKDWSPMFSERWKPWLPLARQLLALQDALPSQLKNLWKNVSTYDNSTHALYLIAYRYKLPIHVKKYLYFISSWFIGKYISYLYPCMHSLIYIFAITNVCLIFWQLQKREEQIY